jgi:uncharacterized membrane-anchored protein
MMSPKNPKLAFLLRHLRYLSLIFCLSLANQVCFSQQDLGLSPGSPVNNSIDWVLGPKKVNLGTVAEVDVPAGFKFLDSAGAHALLQRAGSPDSDGLAGILAPVSEKWFGVIRYADIGYVTDSDYKHLSASAMLKGFRKALASQNALTTMSASPSADLLEWQLKPSYDTGVNAMEWATKAGPEGRVVVNYSITLLGRHGVVSFIAVEPFRPGMDLDSLRDAARAVSFISGERYSDHQPGDKDAHINLAGIATGGGSPDAGGETDSRYARFLWVGIAAGALVIAGLAGIVVAVKKPWRRKSGRYSAGSQRPVFAVAAVTTPSPSQTGTAIATLAAKPEATNGSPLKNGVNGHSVHRNGKHGDRKRKKHFSFYAFHSEMVMNLTRSCYEGALSNPQANGNSEENDTSAPRPVIHETSTPESANALAREISNLIASQQKLIEGQRRFIEEQHKLIQEKNKLIDAENRVLEKQTEFIEEQQLL